MPLLLLPDKCRNKPFAPTVARVRVVPREGRIRQLNGSRAPFGAEGASSPRRLTADGPGPVPAAPAGTRAPATVGACGTRVPRSRPEYVGRLLSVPFRM
ncbi:hypothetical protein GCM10010277_00550 [Streptomyces longisporoflavus]|nr:hypothetical protein GCM10010277_00550 [Streptomyces longisporoflavus]